MQGKIFIGLAKVVEDKKFGSTIIKALPLQRISPAVGEVVDQRTKYQVPSGSATTTPYTSAIWVDIVGSNRDTAPDVVKGEEVELWRYYNTQQVYWSSTGRDPMLRKLEHIEFSLSNEDQASADRALSGRNQLKATLSTRDRIVKITTPTNRKEQCAYEILLDYGRSTFYIKDTLGNEISLQSTKKHIQLTTDTVEIDARETRMTGDLIVDGNITGHSDLKIDGQSTLTGGLTSTGMIKTSGNMKCDKLLNNFGACPNK